GNSASVDRGGGIINFSSGTVTVNNSIVAANTAANGPDCCGMLTSQGYNLIEAGGDCALAGDLTGNVTGQDPGLGPLRDNGGPTQTQALLPGSPAIDAGNPAGCTDADGSVLTTDQRRAPRSRAGDSRCDIGAYEFAAAVPIACAGDCNGDGVVTIDEILTSVSIALGSFPAAACPSLNSDESAAVTIDEILLAVGYALNGCP
ncbi:MAG TPA: choice-of-anchor Q domain-containing protein, partial [Candidatus Acidoferrales bacterium]|nr:choice-of-anchor Q domain-containing protein [Candidatus Acidoferrales bacterium]